jgi:hypothetical protein
MSLPVYASELADEAASYLGSPFEGDEDGGRVVAGTGT